MVTGPIIISIGLILAPTAISNASQNWLLAFIALAVIVVCNIWGKGMVKIVPILLGILVSYVVAVFMGEVNFEAIASAKVFAMAPLSLPKFSFSAVVTIMPIALATMMEHIGDMAAISATTGKNYLNDPVCTVPCWVTVWQPAFLRWAAVLLTPPTVKIPAYWH